MLGNVSLRPKVVVHPSLDWKKLLRGHYQYPMSSHVFRLLFRYQPVYDCKIKLQLGWVVFFNDVFTALIVD